MIINRTMAGIAVAVVVIGVALTGAYMQGVDVTKTKADLTIAQLNQDIAKQREAHAKQRGDLLEAMREKDQANADHMAAVDTNHQKAIHERQIISDRTIAGLRDGSIGLRDKFTTCQRTACSAGSAPSTSPGSSDAAASIELQHQDIELVLQIAGEADAVADQLRACQAIVKADRSVSAR